MSQRVLTSVSRLRRKLRRAGRGFEAKSGFLAGAIAVVSLLAIPVAGQAPAAAGAKPATVSQAKTTSTAKPWTTPRTPWGDPDMQGIWNNATSTPLQRPDALTGKAVLTEEEAEEFQEEVAENLTRDRRDGGADADVARAYNDHWMDARRLLLVQDKRTSLIVDPPDGRIPPLVPLSPERQKMRAAAAAGGRAFLAGMPVSAQDTAPAFRCIIRTDRPPYMGIIYNNTYSIFQGPGYVAIAPEMIHSARIIPLDGRPHLGPNLKQWLGDTRGHFEGDTLVVETTNFRDEGTFGAADPKTYRITERFTRSAAGVLKYEFTISDPATWTKPFTAMVPWIKVDPQDQMYEYMCHEDNYDMVHLLAGGRKREAAGETLDSASRPPAGDGDR